MGRSPRKKADVQAKYRKPQPQPKKRGRRRKEETRGGLDFDELVSAACDFFCDGHTAADITRKMKERYGIVLSREEPYQLIAYAASRGWIRYEAPHEYALRKAIRERWGWLQELSVVHTGVYNDVASAGAITLRDLVKRHHRPPFNKDEVHIAWAGGQSTRGVARRFAQLLCQPADDMPKRLVLHALAAGFDIRNPAAAPNAFFTYFLPNPAMTVETDFVALHAPGVVPSAQLPGLRETAGIRESFACINAIDIFVTSGSLWKHSLLHRCVEKSKQSVEALQKAGCIGDMLWHPLGPAGPIDVDTEIRAMTLLELTDLPKFIADAKNVLLVLGPCGRCNAPKTAVLDSVLRAEPHLITDLVVDSRAARGVLSTSA